MVEIVVVLTNIDRVANVCWGNDHRPEKARDMCIEWRKKEGKGGWFWCVFVRLYARVYVFTQKGKTHPKKKWGGQIKTHYKWRDK